MAETPARKKSPLALLTFTGGLAGAAAVALMGLLITYEVIARAVFGESTLMADEMSAYLLVLLIFMGLAYCLHNDGMLRVEFLFNRFPPKVQAAVELVSGLLALAYMVLLTYNCWMFVYESYDLGYTSVHPSGIKLWIPQLAIPVGCSLMVLEFLAHTFRTAKRLLSAGEAG